MTSKWPIIIEATGGDKVKAQLTSVGQTAATAMGQVERSSDQASAGLGRAGAQAVGVAEMFKRGSREEQQAAAAMSQAMYGKAAAAQAAADQATAAMVREARAADELRAKYNPLYAATRQLLSTRQELQAAYAAGSLSADEFSAAMSRERQQYLTTTAALKGRTAAMREAEAAASAMAREARAADDLRAKYSPLYAATRQYVAVRKELQAAYAAGTLSTDEYTAAMSRERQQALASIAALKGRTNAIHATAAATDQLAYASRMAGLRMQGMFYQVNDIGVSLAGGMNPMVVLAQQGSQIAQIYGFGNGGIGALFRDLGRMILSPIQKFPLLTGAIAATGVAMKGMQAEINKTSEVQVSFGDTALATFEVIRDGIYDFVKPAIDAVAPWFQTAWTTAVEWVIWAGDGIINGIRVAVDAVGVAVSVVPDLFSSAFNRAVSAVLTKMHDMVWHVGNAMNQIATGMNEIFGTELSTSNLSGLIDSLSEASGGYMRAAGEAEARMGEAWQGFRDRADATFGSSPLGDFFDAVKAEAVANALKRTEEEADKAGAASKKAGKDSAKAAEEAKNAWQKTSEALKDYAKNAMDLGKNIGDAITSGFQGIEDMIVNFVKTGKVEVKELVSSIITDFARVGVQRYITGPLAQGLDGLVGVLSGGLSAGGTTLPGTGIKPVHGFYEGGGYTGDAPRSGGLDGRGGFLAVMHPQETVVDHARGQQLGSPMNVTFQINTPDAESFRRSRTQVASDFSRALSAARRVS